MARGVWNAIVRDLELPHKVEAHRSHQQAVREVWGPWWERNRAADARAKASLPVFHGDPQAHVKQFSGDLQQAVGALRILGDAFSWGLVAGVARARQQPRCLFPSSFVARDYEWLRSRWARRQCNRSKRYPKSRQDRVPCLKVSGTARASHVPHCVFTALSVVQGHGGRVLQPVRFGGRCGAYATHRPMALQHPCRSGEHERALRRTQKQRRPHSNAPLWGPRLADPDGTP
jgi:hypothetical protein